MNRTQDSSVLLSAILIVKNEEKRLARALEPLRSAGCEIVVTDTGSTDGTVAIAESFGARIFHFPWNGDEAAARNISLQNATGRWVFWVDADEIADAELVQSIVDDLPCLDADPRIQTGSVLMRNIYQGGSTSLTPMLRLARRRSDLVFEGQIHPQLSFRPEIGVLKGILRHEGYQWTPELRKRKAAHMRAHLEPLCQGDKPPFHRWCELLSVLLIGDERADFSDYWEKRVLYSEEERYRGVHAHYWQENSTNVLLFFSRIGKHEEGVALAEEILRHYPEQISAQFFLLQQAVRERRWSAVLEGAKRVESISAKAPQFYNTFYPEIHGEKAAVWKGLADYYLNQGEAIDWVRYSHPRHIASWIHAAIHFPNRFQKADKWSQILVQLIQEWKAGFKSVPHLRLAVEKIISQFKEGTVERCAIDFFEVVLISEAPISSLQGIKGIHGFLERYPDLDGFCDGFTQIEPGKPIRLEWFYEEGLHRS